MPRVSRFALLILVTLAACRSRTADLGMSDSAFVLVMSELKVVADAPKLTPAVRAQRRDAVLRKRGVTAAQLEKLTPALTAHPQHARRLWAAIDVKALKLSGDVVIPK
jgi:hypothetical protein